MTETSPLLSKLRHAKLRLMNMTYVVQGSVTKNETYPPVGTFRGGWYVYMIFHGVIFLRNVPTPGNLRTFLNELSFVTNPCREGGGVKICSKFANKHNRFYGQGGRD